MSEMTVEIGPQAAPQYALEHPLHRVSKKLAASGPNSAPPPAFGMPLPNSARRTIGPIPPRDPKTGQYLVDDQDPDAKRIYWPGVKIPASATRGLKLFEVDLYPEPLARVYARDEEHALKVYKAEFGITRFGEVDPVVSEVAA